MPTETARPFAVHPQQFESNCNKLRAIIQAYLNTNKTWIVNDFRETVPMDVDYRSKSKGKGKSKSKINSKGKGKGKPSNDEECYVCEKRCHLERDCWSRANHDKMVNDVEVEDPNAEPDEEYVYTIEHEVNVVHLSQSGCEVSKTEEKKTASDWDPRTHEQTARGWDPRTQEQTAREGDPRTQEQTARGWDKRTQEQTAREWDPRTHEQTARGWDPRTQEQTAREWDPRTQEQTAR